jgi:hypothetical protein
MPPGETAPTKYRDHLRGNLTWRAGEIEVAVPEREDALGGRRVVAPDVSPPGLARVGKTAVELNGCQESRIEDVAILVVVAAAISALPLAGRQAVWALDVFAVTPFQYRVQAHRVEGEEFVQLRPPAQPCSAVGRASQIDLRRLPALQAAEYPCARVIDGSGRIGEIENCLLDPRLRRQPRWMPGLACPCRIVNDQPGRLRCAPLGRHGYLHEVAGLVRQPG